MTVQLVVRPFVPDDIAPVVELLQDVSAFRPAPDSVAELVRCFAQQADCYACVAAHDGEVVGFGSLFILNRVRGGRSGVIEDMVVADALRGRGVGRKVLTRLLEEARARGCFKVSLEASISAEPFYKAAGLQVAGQVMKCQF